MLMVVPLLVASSQGSCGLECDAGAINKYWYWYTKEPGRLRGLVGGLTHHCEKRWFCICVMISVRLLLLLLLAGCLYQVPVILYRLCLSPLGPRETLPPHAVMVAHFSSPLAQRVPICCRPCRWLFAAQAPVMPAAKSNLYGVICRIC